MEPDYKPTISDIKNELARMSYGRSALDNLSWYILRAIKLLGERSHTEDHRYTIGELQFLAESIQDANSYREDQQRSMFEQILAESNRLLENLT